jgi:D-lyxose ketol-isomerase
MKRSEINMILREAVAFLEQRRFHLPPFAFWTPEDWRAKGPEVAEIVERRLGWDVTDFGLGDFERSGLLLFTLRNGSVENLQAGRGKLYAEKIMMVRAGQLTPLHFHWQKTEDVINRGGGSLLVRLYNAGPDGSDLLDTAVAVQMDGVRRVVEAGGTVTLHPGESITLETRVYHSFWGEPGKGTVLAGEVSAVNDDQTDNRFYEPLGRFPSIEEDEPPLYLLVGDYPACYRQH